MQENSNFTVNYYIERQNNQLDSICPTFHYLGKLFYLDETWIRSA